MKLKVIAARVEGDDQHYYYSVPPNQPHGMDIVWTPRFVEADLFDDDQAAALAFDQIVRSMELHLGFFLTGEHLPVLDPTTKKPVKRINLPYHIFKLAKLSLDKDNAYRPDAKVFIFVCDIEFDIRPSENFVSFKVSHPQIPKEE